MSVLYNFWYIYQMGQFFPIYINSFPLWSIQRKPVLFDRSQFDRCLFVKSSLHLFDWNSAWEWFMHAFVTYQPSHLSLKLQLFSSALISEWNLIDVPLPFTYVYHSILDNFFLLYRYIDIDVCTYKMASFSWPFLVL